MKLGVFKKIPEGGWNPPPLIGDRVKQYRVVVVFTAVELFWLTIIIHWCYIKYMKEILYIIIFLICMFVVIIFPSFLIIVILMKCFEKDFIDVTFACDDKQVRLTKLLSPLTALSSKFLPDNLMKQFFFLLESLFVLYYSILFQPEVFGLKMKLSKITAGLNLTSDMLSDWWFGRNCGTGLSIGLLILKNGNFRSHSITGSHERTDQWTGCPGHGQWPGSWRSYSFIDRLSMVSGQSDLSVLRKRPKCAHILT